MSKPLPLVSELPELQIVEVPAEPSAREVNDAFWKNHAAVSVDEMVRPVRKTSKPN